MRNLWFAILSAIVMIVVLMLFARPGQAQQVKVLSSCAGETCTAVTDTGAITCGRFGCTETTFGPKPKPDSGWKPTKKACKQLHEWSKEFTVDNDWKKHLKACEDAGR